MNEDLKRPNAALINKEWYGAARAILAPNDLGVMLMKIVSYVLYDEDLPTASTPVGIVCQMIKPSLDSDIRRYIEKCHRNAMNARAKAERVGASGSEWERVGANTTTTPTSTPTSTPTLAQMSLSNDDSRRDRERFFIALYFAEHGNTSPVAELDAFWNYYESLGWKNNKGAVIVRKQAAAAMWRCQYESVEVLGWRLAWYKSLRWSKSFDLRLLSNVRGAIIADGVLTLSTTGGTSFVEFLEDNELALLKRFSDTLGCQELKYSVT